MTHRNPVLSWRISWTLILGLMLAMRPLGGLAQTTSPYLTSPPPDPFSDSQVPEVSEPPGLMISFGTALIEYDIPRQYRQGFIPLILTVDKGWLNFLTFGGYMGYRSLRWNGNGSNPNWRQIRFGGRVTVHAFPAFNQASGQQIAVPGLEPYLAVMLGAKTDLYKEGGTGDLKSDFGFHWAITAGTRYYFNDFVAIYGEVGYGIFAVITLGATLKLSGPTP